MNKQEALEINSKTVNSYFRQGYAVGYLEATERAEPLVAELKRLLDLSGNSEDYAALNSVLRNWESSV